MISTHVRIHDSHAPIVVQNAQVSERTYDVYVDGQRVAHDAAQDKALYIQCLYVKTNSKVEVYEHIVRPQA